MLISKIVSPILLIISLYSCTHTHCMDAVSQPVTLLDLANCIPDSSSYSNGSASTSSSFSLNMSQLSSNDSSQDESSQSDFQYQVLSSGDEATEASVETSNKAPQVQPPFNWQEFRKARAQRKNILHVSRVALFEQFRKDNSDLDEIDALRKFNDLLAGPRVADEWLQASYHTLIGSKRVKGKITMKNILDKLFKVTFNKI